MLFDTEFMHGIVDAIGYYLLAMVLLYLMVTAIRAVREKVTKK